MRQFAARLIEPGLDAGALEKPRTVNGLGDKLIGATGECALAGFIVLGPRDDDDGDIANAGLIGGADPAY